MGHSKFRGQPLIATKRGGGSRTQVSRPANLETGALESALRTHASQQHWIGKWAACI